MAAMSSGWLRRPMGICASRVLMASPVRNAPHLRPYEHNHSAGCGMKPAGRVFGVSALCQLSQKMSYVDGLYITEVAEWATVGAYKTPKDLK